MKAPSLTIGIEEEYQIIDPETRELKSYIPEILDGDRIILEQVKPELHQSIVEVGTNVCSTPAQARAELVKLRHSVISHVAKSGLRVAAAGTHPFSSWVTQEITPLERYIGVKADMAGARAVAADLRNARAHRDRGSGVPHRCNECGALLHAACAVSVDELAVLDGAQHRAQVVPQHRLPQLSAQRRAARLSRLVGLHESGRYARAKRGAFRTAPRSGGTCDRTTRIPRSSSASATCARAWTRRSASRPSSRRSSPSCGSCGATISRFASTRRADRGEQVARGAVGARWQAGRPWARSRNSPARELIRELIDWFLGDVVDELGTRKEVEYAYRILDEGTSRGPAARGVGADRRPQGRRRFADRGDGGGRGVGLDAGV